MDHFDYILGDHSKQITFWVESGYEIEDVFDETLLGLTLQRIDKGIELCEATTNGGEYMTSIRLTFENWCPPEDKKGVAG